jgi:hypothetical protein
MRYLLSLLLCVQITVSFSQTEQSAFTLTGHGVATPFATDYQAIGINPANLDIASQYEGKRMALGVAEFGVSVYSGMLTKDEVRKNIFGGNFNNLTQDEKREYAIQFSQERNSADIDVMGTGYSFQTEKLGSFAFSIKDKVDYYSKLGDDVSDLLWLGYTSDYFNQYVLSTGDTINAYQNISPDSLALIIEGLNTNNPTSLVNLVQGTSLRFSWIREFNFAYGKKLFSTDNLAIYGGVGFKYLMGQGYMQLDAADGKAEAFSSLSPVFNIDYGDLVQNNPSALSSDAGNLTPVGQGFGLDFGATVVYKNVLYASAAVTDIGKMRWDGNVYSLNDVNILNFANAGLNSVDFYDQIQQLNGGQGLVKWAGAQSIETALPAVMRFGAGVKLGTKFQGGFDVVNSLNEEVGSLEKAAISIGAQFTPVRWVHFSMGYLMGGNYDAKIPAGVTFTIRDGGYEFGVALRDIITFFTQNQPTVSAAGGFMRFRF